MMLTDAAGCLTDAGLRVVGQAPPGRAPADLAAHLSGCPRCQRRLLAVDGVGRARAPAGDRRSPRRAAVLALALLLALLGLLWTARLLL